MTYLIETSLVLAILFIPYFVVFRHMTFFSFNRAYLLVSIALALIAPLCPQILHVQHTPAFSAVLPELSITSIKINSVIPDRATDVTKLVGFVYVAVALVILARLILELRFISRLRHTGTREKHKTFWVIRHPEVGSPFSFFNGIFLPLSINSSNPGYKSILEHESAHVRKWHSVDRCVIEILSALMWANPMIHLYKRALKSVHEYEADQVAGQSNKIEYSRLLLNANLPGLQRNLVQAFITSHLKKRIQMIVRKRTPRKALLGYALVLPLFIAVFVVFAFKASPDITTSQHVQGEILQDVYKVVDEMPRFPGCDDVASEEQQQCSLQKLMGYVVANLKYPDSARDNKVEGKVIAKFVVEANGLVSGIKIVRGLDKACDAEVIRVLESMNDMESRWVPGVHEGKKVAVEMVLPVKFAL